MNEAEIILKFKERNLHCGELIKRINEQLAKFANSHMKKNGVTFTQLKMLMVLNIAEGGSATLKELEKFFRTAQSTTAGIASRLEKNGFIESYTDQQDKRIKHVHITEKGRKCCQNSIKSIEAGERDLLSPLTAEQQQQFMSYLQKIYDHIKNK
ncbi:MAG TPA: MarR family transcriptional regulator [Candidatus Alectryocaccobium stercorigallinarum]|nr:MarR family transcriptional regulator [Candidatus Alectryocaccobium stercorigallinarum]